MFPSYIIFLDFPKNEISNELRLIKLKKGKVRAELVYISDEHYFIPSDYLPLMDKYPYILCFDACEKGISSKNPEFAQIVCGINGKRLVPYKTPQRSRTVQACFSIPYKGMVVRCYLDYKVELLKVVVYMEERTDVYVKVEKLWQGKYTCLPRKLKKFEHVVLTAIDKRLCYNCRSPHFIA